MVSLSINLPGAGSCSTHRETEAVPTALPPTKPHTGHCGGGVGNKPSPCGYPAPGVQSGKRGGPPHPAPDVPGPQLPAPPPSPCPSCSWTPNGPSPTCLSLSFPCPPPAGAAGGQAGRRPACPAQWRGHSPSSSSGPPGPEAQCPPESQVGLGLGPGQVRAGWAAGRKGPGEVGKGTGAAWEERGCRRGRREGGRSGVETHSTGVNHHTRVCVPKASTTWTLGLSSPALGSVGARRS